MKRSKVLTLIQHRMFEAGLAVGSSLRGADVIGFAGITPKLSTLAYYALKKCTSSPHHRSYPKADFVKLRPRRHACYHRDAVESRLSPFVLIITSRSISLLPFQRRACTVHINHPLLSEIVREVADGQQRCISVCGTGQGDIGLGTTDP